MKSENFIDISEKDLTKYIDEAEKKLERIIEREGSCNGERYSLTYLAVLVSELAAADNLAEICNGGRFNG